MHGANMKIEQTNLLSLQNVKFYLKNKRPAWCHLLFLFHVLCAQHVSDILMSETCWAHKTWNKIASDIKLVSYSSTITMVHGPINIRCKVLWMYNIAWHFTGMFKIPVKFYMTDSGGRMFWYVFLRPLACWDCEFETRRWKGCLSPPYVCCLLFVVRDRTLRLALAQWDEALGLQAGRPRVRVFVFSFWNFR